MKHLATPALSLLTALLPLTIGAQEAGNIPDGYQQYDSRGNHRHDGFYLSLNVGPGFGGTTIDASGNDAMFREFKMSGPGVMIDLKIGGAIREDLILSFDVIGRTITGPEGEQDGVDLGSSSEDISITDNSYGIGLTRYFMPHNVFVSGTVGTGRMVLNNRDTDVISTSRWGLALHAKVGKEWWVGKNWGLGTSAGYGFAAAKDKEPPSGVDYEGTVTSHQFYLLFNTTFN